MISGDFLKHDKISRASTKITINFLVYIYVKHEQDIHHSDFRLRSQFTFGGWVKVRPQLLWFDLYFIVIVVEWFVSENRRITIVSRDKRKLLWRQQTTWVKKLAQYFPDLTLKISSLKMFQLIWNSGITLNMKSKKIMECF